MIFLAKFLSKTCWNTWYILWNLIFKAKAQLRFTTQKFSLLNFQRKSFGALIKAFLNYIVALERDEIDIEKVILTVGKHQRRPLMKEDRRGNVLFKCWCTRKLNIYQAIFVRSYICHSISGAVQILYEEKVLVKGLSFSFNSATVQHCHLGFVDFA